MNKALFEMEHNPDSIRPVRITDFKPTKMIPESEGCDADGNEVVWGIPIIYFHRRDGKGRIQQQGFVESIDKRHGAVIVFFDWILGGVDRKKYVTKFWFDTCTFYASAYEMNATYEREEKARKRNPS